MSNRFRFPLSAPVAIAVGLVVLLGYFIQHPTLIGLRVVLLRWALILAAIALLVGVINLLSVHWHKVTHRQPGGVYSIVLIISLLGTLAVAAVFGPTHTWSVWLFNYVQVPVESSLLAILAVVLAYAGARVLGRRINAYKVIFVITVLLALISAAAIPGLDLPVFNEFRSLIAGVIAIPTLAGTRGILLGVALGTVATGLRLLMGAERPYGG